MSASKLDTSGIFQNLSVPSQPTQLSLLAADIRFHKSGIEFRSANALPLWTEMTVDLYARRDAKKVRCRGVVVNCAGNRHSGYRVSMVLMNLSRQSQERLARLAFTQPL